jgi:hypothetical protein
VSEYHILTHSNLGHLVVSKKRFSFVVCFLFFLVISPSGLASI